MFPFYLKSTKKETFFGKRGGKVAVYMRDCHHRIGRSRKGDF